MALGYCCLRLVGIEQNPALAGAPYDHSGAKVLQKHPFWHICTGAKPAKHVLRSKRRGRCPRSMDAPVEEIVEGWRLLWRTCKHYCLRGVF
jgi:hypothetical protein